MKLIKTYEECLIVKSYENAEWEGEQKVQTLRNQNDGQGRVHGGSRGSMALQFKKTLPWPNRPTGGQLRDHSF
jgi:hypothetical protein